MKKFNAILAIATVALSAVFGFTSCDKNDEVFDQQPEPELTAQIVPVDALGCILEYEYSAEALDLFEIKYEVTEFDGKVETFEITEPGKGEMTFKANSINDEGNVKLTLTPKDVKAIGNEDTFSFLVFSNVKFVAFAGGANLSQPVREQNALLSAHFFNQQISQSNLKMAQDHYSGTYNAKVSLPENYKNGIDLSKTMIITAN